MENINYHDANEVSNQFGTYYSELGEKLSQKLQTKKYLNHKLLGKNKDQSQNIIHECNLNKRSTEAYRHVTCKEQLRI